MQKLILLLGVLYVTNLNAQLTIQNGLTVTTNGCLITLQGNLINNGNIVGDIGSGWDFAGSTLQTIGGSSTTQFHNLRILNTAGINLGQHTEVNGSIFFQNGKLVLNQYNCTLTPNTTLSGPTANSYVITNGTGVFKQTVPAFNLGIFPVGTATSYTPFVVENFGTIDVFSSRVTDSVYYNYSNGQQSGSPYLTQAVNKTWFLSEAVAGGGEFRTTAYWNAADELPGFNRNLVELRHFEDPTLAWNSNSTGIPANLNILYNIGRSYITGISNLTNRPFGVFGGSAPLPVQWLSFTASPIKEDALLQWTTAQEINNSYFTVQRSANGIHFENIGTVLAGNGQYRFIDTQILNQFARLRHRFVYYRLQQTDKDGKHQYSNIQKIQIQANPLTIQLWPNPAKNVTTVQWYSHRAGKLQWQLMDVNGRVIQQDWMITGTGLQQFKLFVQYLPVGVYQIWLHTADGSAIKSLLVQ
jgi:hypothetical protein